MTVNLLLGHPLYRTRPHLDDVVTINLIVNCITLYIDRLLISRPGKEMDNGLSMILTQCKKENTVF